MATYKTINALRNAIIESGYDLTFKDRIPEATQDNLKEIGEALFNYQADVNVFINTLCNKIGLTYVTKSVYTNQLNMLKKGKLEMGDTIEDIFTDIIRANTYSAVPKTGEECDVFKVNKPNTLSAFHKLNREDVYCITINEDELKKAFVSYDAFGRYIRSIYSQLITSDEVDEYILFKQLVGDSLANRKQVILDKPVDRETSEKFSIALRNAGLSMTFPSRDYNEAGVMKTSSIESQIIILHKDVVPVIDVTQLANNFNINMGQPLSKRIIIVDNFGDGHDDIIGGIIDNDFSMIHDVVIQGTSQYNALHRYWNYFYHHTEVIASSPFANAICFSTTDKTFVINSVNIIPKEQNVRKGFETEVKVEMDYEGTGDLTYVLSVSGNNSNNTKVTQDGKVYVGSDETSKKITITATTNAKFGSSDPKAVMGSGIINIKD